MATFTEHLSLNIQGDRCDTGMLFSVLTCAVLDHGSIQSTCDDLDAAADGNTIRERLNQCLAVADLHQHEIEMNAALTADLPLSLFRSGVEIAIDFHDEPFYGKMPEQRTCVCRDRAKKGTTRCFRIAGAPVVWRGIRLTLALTCVLPE
jgi:hypothetical protein